MERKLILLIEAVNKTNQLLEQTLVLLEQGSMPGKDGKPAWLTKEEVLKILHTSESSLYRYRRDKFLRAYKFGGTLYYDPIDVYRIRDRVIK